MNEPPSDRPPQQWSVHAEFTISHPGASDPRNPPRTGTIHDEKGVRMLYTWSANENVSPLKNASASTGNSTPTPWSAMLTPNYSRNATSSRSLQDSDRMYGFQKGNLFFTSVPPRRNPLVSVDSSSCLGVNTYKPNRLSHNVDNNNRFGLNVGSDNRLCVNDSGYGSGLFSQSVLGGKKLNEDHSFTRKCRSTCSIMLSNDPKINSQRSQCGRTQSLRCQTPSACSVVKNDSFYGCGDPWCHHLHYGDDFSTARRISPVKEVCEDTMLPNCTCVICDPEYKSKQYLAGQDATVKRDVSVQTLEMVNKCTSPLLKIEDLEKDKKTCDKVSSRSKLKRGTTVSGLQSRNRQELLQKVQQKSGSLTSSQVSCQFLIICITIFMI